MCACEVFDVSESRDSVTLCLLHLQNREHAFSTKFTIVLFDFFLEDIDLGSRKLHVIEMFYQTAFHKNLVILFLVMFFTALH